MKLNLQVVVSYSDVFDDEPPKIDDLLRGIPSILSIQVVVHFLTQIHMAEKEDELQFEFLKMWLGRQDAQLKKKFLKIYSGYNKKGENFNFINTISCLHLIQSILKNYNTKTATQLTPDQELRLLKAYLISSKDWTEESHKLIEVHQEYDTPEKIIDLVLPVQLPIGELKHFKDFRLQFYKAIEFFEFCEKDTFFNSMLIEFLKTKNIQNWQEYIITITTSYIKLVEKVSKKSVLKVGEESTKNFFDHLCLDLENYKSQNDFLEIRSKPLLKIGTDEYLFLNINFLIDKLFQGIQFDFFDAIKGKKFDKITFKSFPDFKSKFSEEFTEKYLFKNLIESNFCKKCVHISEESFLADDINPDYYLRLDRKVFLFEFKDLLFSAKSKYSYDIKQITYELRTKLVENDRGKDKGVKQLISTIENILDKGIKHLDNFDFKRAKFFPLIVITDSVFQEMGFNFMIKDIFKDLLQKSSIKDKHLIKEPVIIFLDDLIKFQTLFKEKKIKINSIFTNYNQSCRSNNPWDQINSFSDYLHTKVSTFQIDPTDFIRDKIEAL